MALYDPPTSEYEDDVQSSSPLETLSTDSLDGVEAHMLEAAEEHRRFQGDTSEEELDESDEEETDATVIEDMGKLEDRFVGISEMFRLVKRIGEGLYSVDS